MKRYFLMGILALTVVACDRPKEAYNLPANTHDTDNTGMSTRGSDSTTLTPSDQSETASDRAITQKIRQALMDDNFLSTNAKNIKIITVNGVVTLRGPVLNAQEKETIARKAMAVQGVIRVDNQLDVTTSKY